MNEEFLWVEKYRPKTIKECILPDDLKKTFQGFVDSGQVQNLLLYGKPGSGKTTVAKALCNELGADYLFLNASNENSIDVLRTKLTNFVATGSLVSGGRKVVILDEADNLTPAFMSASRSFIEDFSSNCAFIFTCNYQNKIIEPLRSRLLNIEFNLSENPVPLMASYLQSLMKILDKEDVTYDNKVLAKLVQTFFPDFRRTLNEIQRYSVGGKIDSGIFASIKDLDVDQIMSYMKGGDWKSMREYFEQHGESIDPIGFVDDIYESLDKYLEPSSIPEAVLIIDDYDTKSYFSVSKKVSLIAVCTRIMAECVFK
jgi:DNA polymerase III delta prime subunit